MAGKSVIGSVAEIAVQKPADAGIIHKTNADFWDTVGNEALGVISLPYYGAFISESKHHLFSEITDKKVLEIGCGNGRSLKYLSDLGAGELWGLDLSDQQLKRAEKYLSSNNIHANLICSPMEEECGIPVNYFDYVYSIYAIGWTGDLNGTFQRIASYLKKDGVFIFSWSHPVHKCVALENDQLIFCNSYFDESWYSSSADNKDLMMSDRMLSTYINALAENGFMIENMIEENDEDLMKEESLFSEKARMLPVTFVISARKLAEKKF